MLESLWLDRASRFVHVLLIPYVQAAISIPIYGVATALRDIGLVSLLFQRFLLLCAYILNLVSGLLLPSLYLHFLIQIFNLLVIIGIDQVQNDSLYVWYRSVHAKREAKSSQSYSDKSASLVHCETTFEDCQTFVQSSNSNTRISILSFVLSFFFVSRNLLMKNIENLPSFFTRKCLFTPRH